MEKNKKIKLHPYVFIIMTFFMVILTGTLALMLPFAVKDGNSLSFIDALFTATSSVCVTGLSVIDCSARLSIFGCIIMCILMEIGGLSFITIAICFFSLIGGKIGIANRYLLKEALNQNSLVKIVYLVKRIISIAIVIQLIGVILNYLALMSYYNYDFWKILGYSVFHSIAAFNNAGFDVFGSYSMIPFKDNILLNISTMFLIVFGGIGFIVIDEIIVKRSIKKISIHAKIVLTVTLVLIIGGMLFFKLSMYNEITWLQALFTSVTCRTAGFTTIDIANISSAAYITAMVLMFIGASPCSTGGGIKTTTIVVMFLTFIYYAQGRKPKIFHRRISDGSIFKAFVLFGLAVITVLVGTILVCYIQPQLPVEKVLFEVVSGFSTTGLSMGITMDFYWGSKLVISLLMFFGRIGPLTIIGVVNRNWLKQTNENIQYVEERIIVG